MSEQSSPRLRKPLPRLADYPHRVTDIIRYADLDPQGHVNNAVFATYFESGRVAMFRDPDLGIGVANATFVLARQEIDFLNELRPNSATPVPISTLPGQRSSLRKSIS